MATRAPVGELMRAWRGRRRRSQLDLALDVGVSARHLSFVETGRARPSPELVLAVAERLDVPLRERNTMLLAAGYAPRFGQSDLGAPHMSRIRASLQRVLDAHDPYPGVVIDRQWNVVLSNPAAAALLEHVSPEVLASGINVFRVCLHPDGLAPHTVNFDEWAAYLLRQLRRMILLTGDRGLTDIECEVRSYPTLHDLPTPADIGHDDEPPLLVPFVLDVGEARLTMFTTLTTFGTPQDVTFEELCIELFFPADDDTEALLRAHPATP